MSDSAAGISLVEQGEAQPCDGACANRSWANIIRSQLKIAVPTALRLAMLLVNEVTNMLVLARSTSNPAVLSAMGIGNMMQNVFGLSIAVGLVGAADTLVSQAFGAGEHQECAFILQRSRIIVSLLLIIVVPTLVLSEPILRAVGQDHEVAYHAGLYNKAAVWGLPSLFQYACYNRFLQNRGKVKAQLFITIITGLLHPLWAILLILTLDLGNTGAGYANAITWTLQFVMLIGFVFWIFPHDGLSRRAVLWFSKPCLRGWGTFFSFGIPSMLATCGEWWFWEIAALVVGYMGSVPLAAHVAASNLISVVWMIPAGVMRSTSTCSGQAVGRQDVVEVNRHLVAGIAGTAAVSTLVAVAVAAFRHQFSAMYTSDRETRELAAELLLILTGLVFVGDTTQSCMSSAMRGLGRQHVSTVVYFVTYYGVMLPAGCLLAWPAGLGVRGIYYGMAIGSWLALAVFGLLLCRVDMAAVLEAARLRTKAAADGD